MLSNKWPRIKISELCERIVDCVNKTAPSVDYETPYKMIRTPNIKNGVINLEGCRYVEKETYEKWTRRASVEVGDVLLTREAPMGEVGLVNFKDTVFLGQRIMQYRVNPLKLDSNFLLYSFLSPDLQYQFRKHDSSGSIISHIRVPDCSEFEINTPPLEIQKKISLVLRNIDDKIELNNRINAELEAMAKTLYDYWFVQFDFPDANGKPYKTAGGKMVYNPTLKREIPDGWLNIKLNQLLTNKPQSINVGQISKDEPYTPIDYLPSKKMSFAEYAPSSEASTSLIKYNKGDILIGAMRVYFHRVCVAPFNGITRQTTMVLKPNNLSFLPFLYQVCNEDRAINFANIISVGTQQPYVNWDNGFENYEIPYPNNINIIEKYSSSMQSTVNSVIQRNLENNRLTELRDWLLPMLMNGQVTVK